MKQGQKHNADAKKNVQVAGLTVAIAVGLTVGVPLVASGAQADAEAASGAGTPSSTAVEPTGSAEAKSKTESTTNNQNSGSDEASKEGSSSDSSQGGSSDSGSGDSGSSDSGSGSSDEGSIVPADKDAKVDPADVSKDPNKASAAKKAKADAAKFKKVLKSEKNAEDKAKAKAVAALIKNLGTVTLDKENQVKEARAAYNNLTKAQKKKVGNYKTLARAESKIKVLKKAAKTLESSLSTESSGSGSVATLDGDLSIVDSDRSGQATDIVDIATSEPDGTPTGGSANKYNLKSGQPWCAYFVIWCARKAGVPNSVIPTDPACRDMLAYFSNQHRAYGLDYTPQKGDLIFYAYTKGGVANHVGIVVSATDTTVTTREGNTSGGKVATHTFNRTAKDGRISSNFYILGYASPAYTNKAANHEHSSWVETKAPLNEAYHSVKYAECYCGEHRSSKKEKHTYVWKGSSLVCSECGSEYVSHDEGEYVVATDATLYETADGSSELDVVEKDTVLEVTEVVLKSGEYFGKVEYDGIEGYIKLHDAKINGDAGEHNFEDGVCKDCGVSQAASEPGVYEARNEATTYNSVTGEEGTPLQQSQAVRVVEVNAATDNNYWGKLEDGSLVRMSDLTLEACDYGINGKAVSDLPDGTYLIKSAADSELMLQSSGEETTGFAAALFGNGSPLSANESHYGSDEQKYQLISNDNGTYSIVNVATGLALDAKAASKGLVDTLTGGGAHIGQREIAEGTWSQEWYLEVMEDGSYAFRNHDTKRYLTCSGGGTVSQQNADGTATQGFFLYAQDDVSSFAGNSIVIEGIDESYDYTGKDIEADLKVRYVSSSKANEGVTYEDLEEDTDYLIEYENNSKVGTAKVTITGLGHYAGSITKTFSIVPSEVEVEGVKVTGNKATVSWKSSSKASGYEIMFDSNEDMAHAQTISLKGKKTTSKVLKNLDEDTTYYVKVRSFLKSGKTTTYSEWSESWPARITE